MSRSINKAGLELVKDFEGLFLHAYKDSVGVTTIGYGHTGPDVHMGDTITEAQADALLKQDMQDACDDVTHLIHKPLTDNQFAAIASLVFNVGAGAITNTNLAALLNAGNYKEAAEGILKFDHAGGKTLAGLTRRRIAERRLFLTPDIQEPEAWTVTAGGKTFPAVIVDGKTYAPVRVLAEALGKTVAVEGKSVTIK